MSSSFYFPISYDDQDYPLTSLTDRPPSAGKTYDEWQPSEGRQRRVVGGMPGRWKKAYRIEASPLTDLVLLGVWGHQYEDDEAEGEVTFHPGVGGQVVIAALPSKEKDALVRVLRDWTEATPTPRLAHRLRAQAVTIQDGPHGLQAKPLLLPGIYDATCHHGVWGKDLLGGSGLGE